MHLDCHKKLLHSGFRIIRRDYARMQIRVKKGMNYRWQLLEAGFKTQIELNNRADELLKDAKTIED